MLITYSIKNGYELNYDKLNHTKKFKLDNRTDGLNINDKVRFDLDKGNYNNTKTWTVDDYIDVIIHFYHHGCTDSEFSPILLEMEIHPAVYEKIYEQCRYYLQNPVPVIYLIKLTGRKGRKISIPDYENQKIIGTSFGET